MSSLSTLTLPEKARPIYKPLIDGREVVYLSGPMTGIEDLNRTAFYTAAAELRERGYVVLIPHDGEPETDDRVEDLRSTYMHHDLLQILTQAHLVVVLPGWEDSEGARDEVRVAQVVGVPVLRFADYGELDTPAVVTLPRKFHHSEVLHHD